MVTASIVGASGYTGGELLRLLIFHPEIEVTQITSRKLAGKYSYQVHPNLRNHSTLKFIAPSQLEPCDILFLALPHGESQKSIEAWDDLGKHIIDLSADFRLNSAAEYENWYGTSHSAPGWLEKFVYGLPELHREELRDAKYISGVGCNATASILALMPLIDSNLLDTRERIILELKVGSSEGGATVNPGSHHPERSNVVRTFSPFGHRHTAEVIQELGVSNISLTMTSVDLVRGAVATAHGTVKPGTTQKDLWKVYRKAASENPFLRVVKEKRGIYRVPEPKILAGSNYCDLGFALNDENGHVVSICAIDNLMKGAAGSAVQSMNIMLGFDETLGLEFPGLHPI
ncbi:MAG: N-acetyl-gamma-glutamyl-phosphate reductase [Chloroflexi bacterium]|nr:N-acetyl-gamma-glutamyl-phosphate reductase [Chloroflexota bacterium]